MGASAAATAALSQAGGEKQRKAPQRFNFSSGAISSSYAAASKQAVEKEEKDAAHQKAMDEVVEVSLSTEKYIANDCADEYCITLRLSDPMSRVLEFVQSTGHMRATGLQVTPEDLRVMDYSAGFGHLSKITPLTGETVGSLPHGKVFPNRPAMTDLLFTPQAHRRFKAGYERMSLYLGTYLSAQARQAMLDLHSVTPGVGTFCAKAEGDSLVIPMTSIIWSHNKVFFPTKDALNDPKALVARIKAAATPQEIQRWNKAREAAIKNNNAAEFLKLHREHPLDL